MEIFRSGYQLCSGRPKKKNKGGHIFQGLSRVASEKYSQRDCKIIKVKSTNKDEVPTIFFGPCYQKENPVIAAAKNDAWNHILKKPMSNDDQLPPSNDDQLSPNNDDQLHVSNDDESGKIKQNYLSAMRGVEDEAREAYGESLDSIDSKSFRWMMIKDGCFFLQLAIMLLNAREFLKYPDTDLIFGKNQERKDLKKWIKAMFYVGNQIPLVVLKELMKQSFFQNVIKEKGQWDPPPLPSLRVLHELLVAPFLNLQEGMDDKRSSCSRLTRSVVTKILGDDGDDVDIQSDLLNTNPCDVLQALHRLVLGPDFDNEAVDLEDDDDEDGDNVDLEANSTRGGEWKMNRRERDHIDAATLRERGIRIKHVKGVGSRGIVFKKLWFRAELYLPVFTVDDDTDIILRNLINYENTVFTHKHHREFSSYLSFMKEIVSSLDDVKQLQDRGIICGESQRNIDRLPTILQRINYSSYLTDHLYRVKLQVGSYSQPTWQVFLRKILGGVAFLTLLQTFYTVFAYYHPPAGSH